MSEFVIMWVCGVALLINLKNQNPSGPLYYFNMANIQQGDGPSSESEIIELKS